MGGVRTWPLLAVAVAARQVAIFDLSNYTSAGWTTKSACRVLHAPAGAGTLNLPPDTLEQFDVVFTDDRSKVNFLDVAGRYHFLENRDYPLRDVGRHLAQQKETLPLEMRRQGMSILLPAKLQTEELAAVVQEGKMLMPGNLFVDEGTFESRQRAFTEFTFSVLLNDEGGTPPQSMVDCIAHGTVPIIVGKHHMLNYTHFFPYGVVKFAQFSVEFAINFMMNAPADAFYVYGNSVKMIQEFFHMRYRAPFHQRLQRHAIAACHSMQKPTPALALITIYSARTNFGRRMALRDTWLRLLGQQQPRVIYKFLLADTLLDDGAGVDELLRSERDVFDDMVFLPGTTDEYPIGRKGRAALTWVAHNTDAQFWLKLDDDIYLRPQLVLDRLRRMQRAEAYWGAFDYSGRVVRDTSDPHYTPQDVWAEDVFPPYARGAAVVMSMDLVRQIVSEEAKAPFKKIVVEDVSYGYYLWQLVFERELASVTLIDNDEEHFAMDAKCCTEVTHPNNCWLPLNSGTWIAHHVSPKTIRCMFATDVQTALYRLTPGIGIGDITLLLNSMLAHDETVRSALAVDRQFFAVSLPWEGSLPDLCGCVDTPPPHQGRPLQTGQLHETSTGPRLYVD